MKTDIRTMWSDFPKNDGSVLYVNGVNVATIQEGDEKPFQIYAYDSDWADKFREDLGNDILDRFDSLDEAKGCAEGVFLRWLDKVNHQLVF